MRAFIVFVGTMLMPSLAWASTAGGGSTMLTSFTRTLRSLNLEISGSFAPEVISLGVLILGALLLFTEHGHHGRRIGFIIAGGIILFGGYLTFTNGLQSAVGALF